MKIFITFLLCSMIQIYSYAEPNDRDLGGKEAHGGDSYTLNFLSVANTTFKFFDEKNINFEELDSLKKAFRETKIVSYYKICLVESENRAFEFKSSEECENANGIEKDAVNLPSEKLIAISRTRYEQMFTSLIQKVVLIMHEYAGIERIDDSRGTFSSKLSKLLSEKKDAFTNYMIKNISYYKNQNYVCIIELNKNNKTEILSYENQISKAYTGFSNSRILVLSKESEVMARGTGRSFPPLIYQIIESKDGTISSQREITNRIEVNFSGKTKTNIFIPEINSTLRCYKIESETEI